MPRRARSGSSSEDSPEDATSSAAPSLSPAAASPSTAESEAEATTPASPSPEDDAASSAIAESAGHAVSAGSQAGSAEPSADAGAPSSEAESEEEASADWKSKAGTGDGSLSDDEETEEEPRSERLSHPKVTREAAAETEDDTDDSASEAASSNSSAAPKANGEKNKGKGSLEQFEPDFGTLEEHIRSHDYPKNIATCGPCKFWKHRWEWSAQCTHLNPVTRKKETWLGCKNGMGICLVCNSYWGSHGHSSFAIGKGSFLRFTNILRHARGTEHKEALQAWDQRLRAQAAQGEGETVSTFASSQAASATGAPATSADAVSLRTRDPTAGYRAVVAARTLLEMASSFRSYTVWRDGLESVAHRQALNSEWHCRRLVQSMARYERLLVC